MKDANTVRVKAFRIPREAFPDATEPSAPPPHVYVHRDPFADRLSTVRTRRFEEETVVVDRAQQADAGNRVTIKIWGVAVVLVAVLVVLFR